MIGEALADLLCHIQSDPWIVPYSPAYYYSDSPSEYDGTGPETTYDGTGPIDWVPPIREEWVEPETTEE